LLVQTVSLSSTLDQILMGKYLQSIVFTSEHYYVLRITWLGSVATTISIFTATEHHGIKEGAGQTHYVEVREAVYHKPVLRNHHTQYAMLKQLTVSEVG